MELRPEAAKRISDLVKQVNTELHEMVSREIFDKAQETSPTFYVMNHQYMIMRFVISLLKDYTEHINDYIKLAVEQYKKEK